MVTVAPPLIFKAGGYYKTADRDFKSDAAAGSSTMNSAPRTSKSEKATSSDSKSESKAKKSEGKSAKSKPAASAD